MYQAARKVFFSEALCLSDSTAKSYEELFAKLDTNKDGIVDVSELKAGLSSMGISLGKGAAQVITSSQDGQLWASLSLVSTLFSY